MMVIWNSWNGFTKGNPCLTNLAAFCDKMSRFVMRGEQQMSLTWTLMLSAVPPTVFLCPSWDITVWMAGQPGMLITGWMDGLRR